MKEIAFSHGEKGRFGGPFSYKYHMRKFINIVSLVEHGPVNNDTTRFDRAKAMGFHTDTVVYHGSQAEEFGAFSVDHLGKFTGSPSAKLGFFFGTSRENSEAYSGPSPEKTKFKKLPALNSLRDEITNRCKAKGIPVHLSMGLSSGSAIPNMGIINIVTDDAAVIKNAIVENVESRFELSMKNATEYVRKFNNGEYQPEDEYWHPSEVAAQVEFLKQQREIAIEVINGWEGPLVTKEWGFIGEYYLRYTNPFVYDQMAEKRQRSFQDIIRDARSAGHDAVLILNTFDPKPTDVHVVFHPNQIRSVNAQFDPDHRDSDDLMS